jgi:hypothetical protein
LSEAREVLSAALLGSIEPLDPSVARWRAAKAAAPRDGGCIGIAATLRGASIL